MPVRLILQERPWLVLLLLAALSEAIYLFGFAGPFFLPRWYLRPGLAFGYMAGYTLQATVFYTGAILGLFLCYYLGYRLWATHISGHRWLFVMAIPLLFALTLVPIYPVGGLDLFLYIFQGRIYSQHHLSPYVVTPQDFSADPFFTYASWWVSPSTYGPVWTSITGITASLGGDTLWLSMILFKVLVVVFFLASVALVYLILSRVSPAAAMRGTFLVAWNPLILFEIAGNGHNDIVMAFFLLLAIYFVVEGHWALVLPSLAASALVKYITVLLAPIFLILLLRQRMERRRKVALVGANVALSALVVAFFLRPFGAGWAFSTLWHLEELFWNSPASLLAQSLQGQFPVPTAKTIVKVLTASGIAVATMAQTLVFLKEGARSSSLLRLALYSCYQIIFFYLVLSPIFAPWFMVWLLPLGALLVDDRLAHRSILFSLLAFLSHIVKYFILGIYGDRLNYFTIEAMTVALVFIVPLVLWRREARHSALAALAAEKDGLIARQAQEIERLRAVSTREADRGRRK